MRCSATCIAAALRDRDAVRVGLRCLIVDDSEDFLASARRLLDSQGIEVVGVAMSSADAIRLVGELGPDIALIDVDLGDEDGIALARQVKRAAPATRTILISAHALEDLDLTEAGADVFFIQKGQLGADAIAGLLG
jgi:two-component system nitrate/nitrite response regulator NarL